MPVLWREAGREGHTDRVAAAWGRYIPADPAAVTVMAAGWGFQRVFTWAERPDR